jgi:hypothetical protein
MKTLTALSAFLLGGILLFAAGDKVLHYDRFVATLLNNPLVPASLGSPVASAVVAMEFFIAVCLVLPSLRRHGFALSAVLFCLFAGVIAALMLEHSASPCGCWMSFGSGRADLSHLLLDVACGTLSAYLWWAGRDAEEETAAPGITKVRCG